MDKAVPVIHFDRPIADSAYEAHVALIEQENRNPHLAANPHWRALRDTAFARFRAAFEVE